MKAAALKRRNWKNYFSPSGACPAVNSKAAPVWDWPSSRPWRRDTAAACASVADSPAAPASASASRQYKKNARPLGLACSTLQGTAELLFGSAFTCVGHWAFMCLCDFSRRHVFERIGHGACCLALGCFVSLFVFARQVISHAGTGWYQSAHNDVLFQATQVVPLAHDGSFGQHPGRFLEGSGGAERVGRQRCLGDAQQYVVVGCRQLAVSFHAVVFVQQLGTLDLLARNEAGIARIGDVHPAQHLTNNHFDVLVVDLYALQTIHVLHFIDDIAGQTLDTLQTQDVVRVGGAVDDHLALVHYLAVVHQHLFFLGNQELVADAFQVGNDQALLALGVLAERNRTRDIGKHAGVFRGTGFEQLGHARQTTGNVARLLRFLRNTRQNFTDRYLLAIAHRDQRTDRERDIDHVVGAGDTDLFTALADQFDLRTHHDLAATRLGRDDDQGGQAGYFVQLPGHRYALFDVLETDDTGVLGHDRTGERIPVGQPLASLDDVTVAHGNGGTVGDLVAFAFAAGIIKNDDLARAGDRHAFALGVGDVAQPNGKTDSA